MERLRQKYINTFIETLNTREQKYIYEKLKDIIEKQETFEIDFTINGRKSYLYL